MLFISYGVFIIVFTIMFTQFNLFENTSQHSILIQNYTKNQDTIKAVPGISFTPGFPPTEQI